MNAIETGARHMTQHDPGQHDIICSVVLLKEGTVYTTLLTTVQEPPRITQTVLTFNSDNAIPTRNWDRASKVS